MESPGADYVRRGIERRAIQCQRQCAGNLQLRRRGGHKARRRYATLPVIFTPTDTIDYTTAFASVNLTVAQATPVITWPVPSPITLGAVLGNAQLNATANVAGTFVYTPPAGTILIGGVQSLSVTFTPTDSTDYATATASVKLIVNSPLLPTPVITWPTPAAVPYGTPLSNTQLDAMTNVPGSCAYDLHQRRAVDPGRHAFAFSHLHSVESGQLQPGHRQRQSRRHAGTSRRSLADPQQRVQERH